MGFAVWSFVLIGALAGHIATVVNYVLVSGWFRGQEQIIETIVTRAVQSAVRECLLDLSKTEPLGIEPQPTDPDYSSWSIHLNIKLFGIWFLGILLGGCSLSLVWWCCATSPRVRGGGDSALSPSGSPLRLKDIARNQLAEIRLRRNEPGRALRSA